MQTCSETQYPYLVNFVFSVRILGEVRAGPKMVKVGPPGTDDAREGTFHHLAVDL